MGRRKRRCRGSCGALGELQGRGLDCGLEIFDGNLVIPRNFELKCVILSIGFVPLNVCVYVCVCVCVCVFKYFSYFLLIPNLKNNCKMALF